MNNITLIIIALNEEFAVNKCLSSMKEMKLNDCEVICIDSGSTDNTISVMKSFQPFFERFRIFSIDGYANAAIARNIGIQNATKEYIFFVDGDVELRERFIIEGLKKIKAGCSAVVGNLEECQYTPDYGRILKKIKSRENIKEEKVIYISGGTFLVTRASVNETGFFDERFENCQDIEFTSRLTKRHKMVSILETMGVHHTIPYYEKSRVKRHFSRRHPVYLGMVFRRNVLSTDMAHVKSFLLNFYHLFKGTLLGLCLVFGFLVVFLVFPTPLDLFIIFSFLVVDILLGLLKKKRIGPRIFMHYVDPLLFLFGLFFNVDPRTKSSIIEVT